MIHANAYVNDNKLYVLGIADSEIGPIPFGHIEPCQAPNGSVDLANREVSPEILKAIDNSQAKIMNNVEREKMKVVGEELVLAARAGDQVAMSHLILIGENAKRGNQRAQYSKKIVEDFIKRNPTSEIGTDIQRSVDNSEDLVKMQLLQGINETKDNMHYATIVLNLLPALSRDAGAVTLSHGPILNDEMLMSVCQHLPESKMEEFAHGVNNWAVKPMSKIHALGQQMGLARCIQLVSRTNMPISILSPTAGWEMGES